MSFGKKARHTGLAAAALLLAALPAAAQTYPDRPVRVVVPGGPGGPGDVLARWLSTPLSASLGQQFVIDNKAGGNGSIAFNAGATAKPDGYTLVLGALSQQIFNPVIYPKLSYDPEKDFVPVILLARIPYVLVAHPGVPGSTIVELVAHLKANPGKLNYASHGPGSTAHVTTEMFRQRTGVEMTHVPYRGDAAAVTALIGGEVQLMFTVATSLGPHIAAGKLKGFATASASRSPGVPTLPTFDELSFPNFHAETWYTLLAPTGTPRPVVELLNREVNKVLAQAELKEQIARIGAVPAGGSIEDVTKFLVEERVKWTPVVAGANITPE